jgi:hypothetical protein
VKKIALIIIAIGLISTPLWVRLSKITCTSFNQKCPAEIQNYLNSLIGKTYINVKNSTNNIPFMFPYVSSLRTKFYLPTSLAIDLNYKKPYAALFWSNTYYLVSEGSIITSTVGQTSLPVMNISAATLTVGKRIAGNAKMALDILVLLNKGFGVNTANFEDDKLTIIYKSNTKILFPIDIESQKVLGMYALVLSRLNTLNQDSTMNSGNKMPVSVDMRFKNPIFKYNE